jgi:hypothetical protein
MVGTLALALLLVAGLSGCSGDDDAENETTTTFGVLTSPAGGTSDNPTTAPTSAAPSTTDGPDSSTSTATFPRYQIVSREAGDDGDIVVVLLDTTSYGSLTDIDLQNVVADVVAEFPPVLEAHVVDSAEAAAIVLSDDLDDAGKALLAEHYLVRLEEGFRIVYSGPFESRGVLILGS